MRFFSGFVLLQVVAGRENARKVVEILMANPDAFYACDTEVSEVDLAVSAGRAIIVVVVICM